MSDEKINAVCVGGLREDFLITAANEARLHQLGGNAVYAAVGARIWARAIGLVARVGSNYPPHWLDQIEARGIDVRGVNVLSEPLDTRTFYAYTSLEERVDSDPAAHFARLDQPLPKALEGYTSSTGGQDERDRFGPLAVRPPDLPEAYIQAQGVHLAPAEFVTHNSLPPVLRRQGLRYVTCDPSIRYMQPGFADDVKRLVFGLDAFLPSEMEVRAYFRKPMPDLWAAAEAFGAMGAKLVVIKLGARGQYVYHTAAGRRWHVPAYPARLHDVTGAGDAYCGGFLMGLIETSDPIEAALRGAVSASLVIEGSGALYALDATPGLAQARLDSLRESVRAA